MTSAQNTSCDQLKKWDHFEILAKGQSDTHCETKEALLLQELKPTINDNACQQRKALSLLVCIFYMQGPIQQFCVKALKHN